MRVPLLRTPRESIIRNRVFREYALVVVVLYLSDCKQLPAWDSSDNRTYLVRGVPKSQIYEHKTAAATG